MVQKGGIGGADLVERWSDGDLAEEIVEQIENRKVDISHPWLDASGASTNGLGGAFRLVSCVGGDIVDRVWIDEVGSAVSEAEDVSVGEGDEDME